MIEQIIKFLVDLDTYKLFCSDKHPNIYDAINSVGEKNGFKDIQKALMLYFEHLLKITTPNTQISLEAERMIGAIQNTLPKLVKKQAVQDQKKNINDSIVDCYLNSLKEFAADVNEPILFEHISYLEND